MYLVGIVGFTAGIVDYAIMDIVRSCVETECESFPAAFEIWNDFTSETLIYLFTPLIFMYILLNFDIINSDASENRWLTRIMVILMLLIVSSSVIELLQSFLPVPEMISSAALAMVVAIFIGWEERIMTNLMREGDTVSKKLIGMDELVIPKIDDRDYDIMSASIASVVFFSTVAVKLGMPFHSSVSASKGAIEGLTRSLAAEFAPKIRVNAIAPSILNTPMSEKFLNSETKIENARNRHPLKEIGSANDIAEMVKFLLIDESKWMTGQIIPFDGGMSSVKTN